ncbi:MAG: aminopeptidase P family protein [Clostridiales bacterium]|nr:aminopeptidase P family protein [Clostridiales bacterium]
MRAKRLMESLEKRGISAALIHRRVNMRYLSGYTGEGCLLVTPNGMTIFTDFRYIEQVSRQSPQSKCVRTGMGKSTEALILEEMGDIRTLAIEDNHITYPHYKSLEKNLPGVELSSLGGEIETLRRIKDQSEIDCIVRAADIACKSFDQLLGIIRPGMTEKELAVELNYFMLKNGAEGTGFDTIACAGANGSLPHAVPSDYQIQKGDLMTFDFGAVVDGYTCDMTRTIAIGEVSGELRAIYDTVLNAQMLALEAIHPGVKCCEIDKIARDYIDARYPGAFGHSLGHGVGMEVHEGPVFARSCEEEALPGHVLTVEPGVYIPNLGGCRIEDMVIITENGYINPITAPKHLITI